VGRLGPASKANLARAECSGPEDLTLNSSGMTLPLDAARATMPGRPVTGLADLIAATARQGCDEADMTGAEISK
jgi:hypothetical protein